MAAEVGNGHPGTGTPPLVGPEPKTPTERVEPAESVPPPSSEAPETPARTPPMSLQQPPVPAAPLIVPTPPPPGWYGDIYGNPPRWWDGTAWTEHVLVPLPAPEPAGDGVELNFIDNALISFSLAPDWAKFVAAAAVTAVIALIGLGILNGGSEGGETPDGFVPQTPELEDGTLPGAGDPAEPGDSTDR